MSFFFGQGRQSAPPSPTTPRRAKTGLAIHTAEEAGTSKQSQLTMENDQGSITSLDETFIALPESELSIATGKK